MKYILAVLALFPSVSLANDYAPAINTAREAFLVQTGIKGYIRKAQKMASKEFMEFLEEYGVLEETAIGAATYKVYRSRQVSFRYKGKRFTLTPNSVTISMGF